MKSEEKVRKVPEGWISRLVLCDREEEYTRLMGEFLQAHKEIPWNIHTYTSVENLMKCEETGKVTLLVVSERTYDTALEGLKAGRTVILSESGCMREEGFCYVDKYQQAMSVLKELLEIYLDLADVVLPQDRGSGTTRFIGFYSPVRRCLQTTFAVTLGQLLAGRHKTLYLNFEHFSGLRELAAPSGTRDLADLLYFVLCQEEWFRLRLDTMVEHIGALDFIPPMKYGQNLISISVREWQQLFEKIRDTGAYEYVIVDLSENMQGLFELLRFCTKVFTMTREDRVAQGKLEEYQWLLKELEYGDVWDKTSQYAMPKLHRIPEELEQYSRGEMAEFAGNMVRELEEE